MMIDWKCVHKTPDGIEAELLKNELLNNEISAVILNKKDSVYLIGYYEIHVAENQEEAALRLIEEFNKDA